jgi:EpsI family protein
MCLVSAAGIAARPDVVRGRRIGLEERVPKAFGDWTRVAPIQGLYDVVLARTYVHKDGYLIMLSLAYGGDQRGALAAHRPEVFYPAQGFQVRTIHDGALATPYGTIDVHRLETNLGTRNEPVTYWLTVGHEVIHNKWDRRVAEILLLLTGRVPDGLLVRVSSIDEDSSRAFAMQQRFVADLMAAVPADFRHRLSGLTEVRL